MGWPPATAWAATPREIAWGWAGRYGEPPAGPLARRDVEDLMALFPDHPDGGCDDRP